VRPADLITEALDEYRDEIGDLARSEEDVLSYALFPNAARNYFERRHRGAEEDVFLTGEAEEASTPEAPSGSTDRVRELIAAVEAAANVDEVTVEDAGLRITVRKGGMRPFAEPSYQPMAPVGAATGNAGGSPASPAAPANEPPAAGSHPAVGALPAATPTTTGAGADDGLYKVTAPMVGTFFSAPSPSSPPFVEVGQHVSEGDVLCILEAMKLMNEVASEVSGTIRAVLAENGAAVEFGQPLFAVDLDGS
jgi:oxaloacetate decarboxylase (Na+ extruding) subunit alpha